MSAAAVRVCQCPVCQQEGPHPDRERHRQMNLFLSRLDEAQRRWYVALEAELGECQFRNIRLTQRPSSNPPAEKVAMADEGFTSIFDGLDFAGWKYRDGHKGHWTAKDGVIQYDGQSLGPESRHHR